MSFIPKALLLTLASIVNAQYGPGGQHGPHGSGGGGSNPYSGSSGGGGGGQYSSFDFESILDQRQKILIAHGVLASLAFVIFFPIGSILIRLASFRGIWLIHGLFQTFAYLVYIAAFGIGVWIVRSIPVSLIGHYHPTIGIVILVFLFFQPILGLTHHYQFKKHSSRTIWSYGHLWLGRIVITLGMINGGLGMLLATETGYFVPSKGQMIAYGIVAGIMWLLWMAAAIIGERRRARALSTRKGAETPLYKEQYA